MATFRLFGDQVGPAAASAAPSSGLLAGFGFQATTGGCWLEGYWYWVCATGQPTSGQRFALWQPYSQASTATMPPVGGVVIPEGGVTSGALKPGQWNFIRLPKAIPLSIGTWYVVMTGSTVGIPATGAMFGPGQPYASRSNGPLLAASDVSPNLILGGAMGQSMAVTGKGADPTSSLPVYDQYYAVTAPGYYWIDPQVTTEAPPGAPLRLWPNMPVVDGVGGRATSPPDTTEQSAGTEFWLSDQYAGYTLDKIWFWSPIASPEFTGDPKAVLLPDSAAVFDCSTKAIVSGTQLGDPAQHGQLKWSKPDGSAASPGDGWVYVTPPSTVTLSPGKYKTSVYCYAGGLGQAANSASYLFFGELESYFANGGPAAAQGIVNGPLSSPNGANASPAVSNGAGSLPAGTLETGNSTYQNNDDTNTGQFLYPYTHDDKDKGETRWIDVEVTPVATTKTPRSPMVTFFP